MGEHEGHRARMIERLEKSTLYDHELLEVLLFNALPRRNTNDLAHRLLAEFGSVSAVLSASITQLQRVDGIGPSVASYLSVIGKILERFYLFDNENAHPNVYDAELFLAFAQKKYANMEQEVLDVYFVENDGTITGCKRFSQESSFQVCIQPEDLIQLLAELKTAGIVVVHNHPSGVASPSDKDEEMTAQMQVLCSLHNVIFCDHVIAANDGVYSYYFSGKMQGISKNFSLQTLLSSQPMKGTKPMADGKE